MKLKTVGLIALIIACIAVPPLIVLLTPKASVAQHDVVGSWKVWFDGHSEPTYIMHLYPTGAMYSEELRPVIECRCDFVGSWWFDDGMLFIKEQSVVSATSCQYALRVRPAGGGQIVAHGVEHASRLTLLKSSRAP
jgi:hypothetical protein